MPSLRPWMDRTERGDVAIRSLRLERVWPSAERKKLPELHRLAATKNHIRVKIGRIDLPNELPTPSAGGKDVQQAVVVPPDSHDFHDLVLACRHHRGDGCMLCAEAGTTSGIDADPRVPTATRRHECRRHIA